MTTINNLVELYSLKGNVTSGKIILFNNLEKQKLDADEIKSLVVDEYDIMTTIHFKRSWKEYQQTKRWLALED